MKIVTKFLLRNEDIVLFVKVAKIANKTYDRIIRFFPSLVGTTDPVILDIGANIWQFAARLSRQFPGGQIYCFEPLHDNAVGLRRLKRWLKLDNVTVCEEALCDKIGVEAMHIPVFGGTYRDGALAVLEGSTTYDNVRCHVESVRTNTIDAFVTVHGIGGLDLVKIDTEGAEDRVVKGGMGTICEFLPTLYVEASHREPWLDALYDRGYCPLYTDGTTLRTPRDGEQQINVLLVHRSKINQARGTCGIYAPE